MTNPWEAGASVCLLPEPLCRGSEGLSNPGLLGCSCLMASNGTPRASRPTPNPECFKTETPKIGGGTAAVSASGEVVGSGFDLAQGASGSGLSGCSASRSFQAFRLSPLTPEEGYNGLWCRVGNKVCWPWSPFMIICHNSDDLGPYILHARPHTIESSLLAFVHAPPPHAFTTLM